MLLCPNFYLFFTWKGPLVVSVLTCNNSTFPCLSQQEEANMKSGFPYLVQVDNISAVFTVADYFTITILYSNIHPKPSINTHSTTKCILFAWLTGLMAISGRPHMSACYFKKDIRKHIEIYRYIYDTELIQFSSLTSPVIRCLLIGSGVYTYIYMCVCFSKDQSILIPHQAITSTFCLVRLNPTQQPQMLITLILLFLTPISFLLFHDNAFYVIKIRSTDLLPPPHFPSSPNHISHKSTILLQFHPPRIPINNIPSWITNAAPPASGNSARIKRFQHKPFPKGFNFKWKIPTCSYFSFIEFFRIKTSLIMRFSILFFPCTTHELWYICVACLSPTSERELSENCQPQATTNQNHSNHPGHTDPSLLGSFPTHQCHHLLTVSHLPSYVSSSVLLCPLGLDLVFKIVELAPPLLSREQAQNRPNSNVSLGDRKPVQKFFYFISTMSLNKSNGRFSQDSNSSLKNIPNKNFQPQCVYHPYSSLVELLSSSSYSCTQLRDKSVVSCFHSRDTGSQPINSKQTLLASLWRHRLTANQQLPNFASPGAQHAKNKKQSRIPNVIIHG
ncbi:putative signal peptide protein [Puccinia sorghi]|uniref:Putative signal peptide protein n=1 Tax=Puccinia sorghi TaxID=27349 RepID=A0A0L6UTN5_9BASI|nr:putative signal peptide protein [Puccinia sorghi]